MIILMMIEKMFCPSSGNSYSTLKLALIIVSKLYNADSCGLISMQECFVNF